MPARGGGSAFVAAFAAGLAACFTPVPSPGAPCADGALCPSGLACIHDVCVDPNAPCVGLADGTPCGDPASADCDGADTCVAGVCVSHVAADGAACADCAAGVAACGTCAAGACPDATCTTSTGVPIASVLASPVVGGNQNEGNMFDVVAAVPLTITSFETHATAGMTEFEIWHRPGTHVGSETDRTAWTRLGAATFATRGPGVLTPIPIPIGVTLQAGERHAFYLTHRTLLNRYHNGTAVGTAIASTPELTVYEGVANDYATTGFGPINTPRIWEGKIHYRSGGGATLATAPTGTVPSDGVMFDVEARADVETAYLAVHLGAGTHDVDVYLRRGGRAGVETTAAAWAPIAQLTSVLSAGPGALTPLPLPVSVFLARASTTAFYVATRTAAVQTEASRGLAAASDADVTIHEGVAVSGTFGSVGAAVRPDVELGYGRCD